MMSQASKRELIREVRPRYTLGTRADKRRILDEGGPALAGRPEWQSGCPAGGAAVAVWVRDSDANMTELTSRRIGLRCLNCGAVFTPAELTGYGHSPGDLDLIVFLRGAG